MIVLIGILALFFAMNMGGASFAASFSAPYGGKVISQKWATVLFIFFVVLGSCTYGQKVSVTLGAHIVDQELLTHKAIALIFFSAGVSMYVANLMHIPQSTSLVTVAAIAGVGAALGRLHLQTIYHFFPFWLGLPLLSFILTRLIGGSIYPPRHSNFWVYERLVNQQKNLKIFVVIASCYSAFSVGTNNVANVVGPMLGVKNITLLSGLFIFGLIYGMGAIVFTGPMRTTGNKIVPLGLLTASIISFVSGTLMIVASSFGIPQSFVMLQMGALFAISTLKYGTSTTFESPLTRKTFYTWTINPVLTFFVTWIMAKVILS